MTDNKQDDPSAVNGEPVEALPVKDKTEALLDEFLNFKKEFKAFAEAQDKKLRNTRNRLSSVLKHIDGAEDEGQEVVSQPVLTTGQPSADTLTREVLAKLELSQASKSLTDEQRKLVSRLSAEDALAVIAAFKAKEEREQAPQAEQPRVSVSDEPRLPGGSMGGAPAIRTQAELNALLTTPEGRSQVQRWRAAGGSIKDLY